MNLNQTALDDWLASRPVTVQKTARQFPPGTKFRIHGELVYVIAYGESGGLYVTTTSPGEDYRKAVATRKPLCECCVANLGNMIEA